MNESARQIEEVAWKSCEVFRGLLEEPLSVQYVLSLLLLKLLSRRLEDVSQRSQKFDAPGAGLAVPPNWPAKDLFSSKSARDCGKYIDSLLLDLERENPLVLGGVFREISFSQLAARPYGAKSIEAVMGLISQLDMRPSSVVGGVLGDVYENLLERLSSSGRRGEFDAPKSLATLVAKLIDPPSRGSFYDPVCRRGSMLTALAREFGADHYSFAGQDSKVSNWSSCNLGMLMYGVHEANIRCADSLESPILDSYGGLAKYDVVVSNPPFGSASWESDKAVSDLFGRFYRGVPPRSRAEYAFLLHMIESAKDQSGEVAALLPLGALFRQGVEKSIRKSIVEEGLVRAVVALPANLFYSTGIPVALLLLTKRKKKTADILFVDASREFGNQGGRNYLRDEHISKIVATVRKFEAQEGYCCRVSLEEVRKREYDLSVGQYLQGERRGALSAGSIEREIREAEEELSLVQQDLQSCLNILLKGS